MDLGKIDRQVRNLKPKDKRYELSLGRSVVCRMASSGGKSLVLKVMIGNRQQRLLLGHYPATTVKEAFERADVLKAQIREGHDPRVEARREADGTSRPRTVAEAAEIFITSQKAKIRVGWAKETERSLRVEVLPKLGLYPLAQLRRSDLAAVISAKAAALRAKGGPGTSANRLMAILSKFTRFCEENGWLTPGIGSRLPRPVAETPKERTLTSIELGSLWIALQGIRSGQGAVLPVYGDILALLALSACRCSEITGLTQSAFDVAAGTITIANGKTRASSRTLPLPPIARSIVCKAAEGKKATDRLFSLPKSGGVIPSNEVSRAARKLVIALGHRSWTPHDLRRTAVSVMAEAGIEGDVRRRITGHLAHDVHGRVYDRAARLNDVMAGLVVVEHFILAAARRGDDQASSNIVAIRR